MFPNFGELGDLLKNAGRMREMMEKAGEALARVEAEGMAGGGMVTARANGRMEVLSLRIDPSLLNASDREMVEELVAAAVNQALTKARDEAARSVQGLGGSLPLDPSRFFK